MSRNADSASSNDLFNPSLERRVRPVVLAAWTAGLAAFGFALGTYVGAGSAWLAMWKVPLAVVAAVVITLPTLAVFTALASGTLSFGRAAYLAALTSAALGALLLALAPVMWLFASSSLFLVWPMLVAVGLGTVALLVVGLRVAGLTGRARFGYVLWLLLLVPVTFQMATTLRPVITDRGPEGPSRMFFLEHFAKAAEFKLPETEG